jgi:hypothetical protein
MAANHVTALVYATKEANGRWREDTQILLDAGTEVRKLLHGAHEPDLIFGLERRSDLIGELLVYAWVAQEHVDHGSERAGRCLGSSDTIAPLVEYARTAAEEAHMNRAALTMISSWLRS